MDSERIKKIKRMISRSSYEEVQELYNFCRKQTVKKWNERVSKIQEEKAQEIRKLEPGTKVIYTDSRSELCGAIGKIERHVRKGRYGLRTVVDFGSLGRWKVLSHKLSIDLSENHLKRLKNNNQLSRKFEAIINNWSK